MSSIKPSHNASNEPGVPAQREHLAQAGKSGTALSNTVPLNCNNNTQTQILRTGIDSLYVSYPGDLIQESAIRLEKCKGLAQDSDPQTAALAQMELGTHTFEVSDKGRSIYPYVLRDNWYELQVSKEGAINKPLAFTKIASSLLTTQKLPFIIEDLTQCIEALGIIENIINLSRVDICADFITNAPLASLREIQWVTRAKNIDRHTVDRHFSGFSIGRGGKITARLYNKTLELQKKPRPYLEDIWKCAGWNGTDTVWRLEFQLMRQLLKEFGVSQYPDLEASLSGLWDYCTSKWLRLTIPSETDKTQSRWPTADVWTSLQAAPFSGNTPLTRVDIEKVREPSEKTMYENGLSALTSFMALNGYSDYEAGVKAYIAAAREYHDRRSLFTNVDFREYINQKLRIKQRRFNSAVNVHPRQDQHPADQAVSNAYRKAKDGE